MHPKSLETHTLVLDTFPITDANRLLVMFVDAMRAMMDPKVGDATQREAYEELEWRLCSRSFTYWIGRYGRVLHADGSITPIELWDFQRRMAEKLQARRCIVAIKSRQLLGTTLTLLYCLWLILFRLAQRVYFVSYSREAGSDAVQRLHVTYDNLPDWMISRAGAKYLPEEEQKASVSKRKRKTQEGSSLLRIQAGYSFLQVETSRVRSAKGKTGVIVIDEWSEHDNPMKLMQYAIPAARRGAQIIAITNACGPGPVATFWQRAREGLNSFDAHFWGAFSDPTLTPEAYKRLEEDFIGAHPDADRAEFKRQYPVTVQDAMTEVAASRFSPAMIEAMRARAKKGVRGILEVAPDGGFSFAEDEAGAWLRFEEPSPDGVYVLGVDTSGGAQNSDWAVIEVVRLFKDGTAEQVMEYRARVEPVYLVLVAVNLGRYYMNGLIVPEANWHGHTFIQHIRPQYFNLYRREVKTRITDEPRQEIGYWTHDTGKVAMIDQLAYYLGDGADATKLRIHSPVAIDELSTFVRMPDGIRSRARKGAYDDCVMALGFCVVGAESNQVQALAPLGKEYDL